jgi:hypothetical protein
VAPERCEVSRVACAHLELPSALPGCVTLLTEAALSNAFRPAAIGPKASVSAVSAVSRLGAIFSSAGACAGLARCDGITPKADTVDSDDTSPGNAASVSPVGVTLLTLLPLPPSGTCTDPLVSAVSTVSRVFV